MAGDRPASGPLSRSGTGELKRGCRRPASTLSEKLAAGSDALVLDLTCGDGGFMSRIEDARAAPPLRRTRPEAQHFGRISVGDDSFIGQNCIILPGARIGSNCVVGAGSVVRGVVADGTVVMGNPAQVVGRTSLLVALMDASPDTLDTYTLPEDERQRRIRQHFGRPAFGGSSAARNRRQSDPAGVPR